MAVQAGSSTGFNQFYEVVEPVEFDRCVGG